MVETTMPNGTSQPVQQIEQQPSEELSKEEKEKLEEEKRKRTLLDLILEEKELEGRKQEQLKGIVPVE